MRGVDELSARGLQPQVLLLLISLGIVAGLAALTLGLQGRRGTRAFPGLIVPHPGQPASMLAFVALPAFLTFVRLVLFAPFMTTPLSSLNSPQSWKRYANAPVDLVLNVTDPDSPHRYSYPEDSATGDLTAATAARVGIGPPGVRAEAVSDLAWWTSVCPGYAPFTLPRLAGALRDPEWPVKTAAVKGLGSIGGHAAPAIPALRAARGSGVVYFDFVLDEAVFLIKSTPKWPAEDVCQDVPIDELERRSHLATRRLLAGGKRDPALDDGRLRHRTSRPTV